ncbi:hypothetical protein L1785_07520 [Antribacter sp. KLBMP9083]|uniref:Uncharacterized protein n=1 Tax=Antribacter soli TaxID=2910976 RepID=A0AA41U708_9MICO|nr:hypothetical protein [Antribacter soli]MCF4120825.1 hypothetical protein [Antribacter soli]
MTEQDDVQHGHAHEDATPEQAADDPGASGPTPAEPAAEQPLDDVAVIVATLKAAQAPPRAADTLPDAAATAEPATNTAAEPAAHQAAHAPVPPPPAPAAPPVTAPAAPVRAPAGVRRSEESDLASRWNPGARYRSSRLAALRDAESVVAAAARAARAEGGPVHLGPAPAVGPTEPRLAGRLYRGPARRTRVFDRDIWRATARTPRSARDISEVLAEVVTRYRQGAIDTTGLVRAIGHALAA